MRFEIFGGLVYLLAFGLPAVAILSGLIGIAPQLTIAALGAAWLIGKMVKRHG